MEIQPTRLSKGLSYYIKMTAGFVLAVIVVSMGIVYALNTYHYQTVLPIDVDAQAQARDNAATTASQDRLTSLVGKDAPDFEARLLDGTSVKLSDYRGRNVILIFWATWCSWCARELPQIKEFVATNKENIVVLALDRQESVDIVDAYVKEKQLNFTVALDSDLAISELYGVTGTPSHFYINTQGKVIKRIPGYEDADRMNASVSELLKSN